MTAAAYTYSERRFADAIFNGEVRGVIYCI